MQRGINARSELKNPDNLSVVRHCGKWEMSGDASILINLLLHFPQNTIEMKSNDRG